MIFLLVSAVALLFSSALPSPITTKENPTLNEIIDLADKYNRTVYKSLFVEDVSELAKAGCNNKFLCKVHDILEMHTHLANRTNEQKIVKNLNSYISGTKENCAELLKDLPATGRETDVTELLTSLVKCVRNINFNMQ